MVEQVRLSKGSGVRILARGIIFSIFFIHLLLLYMIPLVTNIRWKNYSFLTCIIPSNTIGRANALGELFVFIHLGHELFVYTIEFKPSALKCLLLFNRHMYNICRWMELFKLDCCHQFFLRQCLNKQKKNMSLLN